MPKGAGTSNGSYAYLLQYGYNNITTATNTGSLQYNLSTPLSGYFEGGSSRDQGTSGYFWAADRRDNYNMYNLYLYGQSSVTAQNYSNRAYGSSVRCIVKP